MFHPFNSARLVRLWLRRCDLIAANIEELSKQFESVDLDASAGLLFPGEDAPLLSDLAATERPKQLILPDGTWHHVKTLMREIPRLQSLPRYQLAPTSPGRYRIRREPNLQALSTLEATVQAIESLEPETPGIDRLMGAFERMISSQLEIQPTSVLSSNPQAEKQNRSKHANIPKILLGDQRNIVVATGEVLMNRSAGRTVTARDPLSWSAFRLEDGSAFRCVIESEAFSDPRLAPRLGISDEQLRARIPLSIFRSTWEQFLRPNDRLVVFHPKITQLLHHADTIVPPALALRSINHPRVKEKVKADVDFSRLPSCLRDGSRSSLRLANLVAMLDEIRRDEFL